MQKNTRKETNPVPFWFKRNSCEKLSASAFGTVTNRKYRKFTLVELLVVIAIISILAGMLLPALEQGMATAKTINCLNQMKQLYLITIEYTSDYNQHLYKRQIQMSETWNGVSAGGYPYILDQLGYLDSGTNYAETRCPYLLATTSWSAYGFRSTINKNWTTRIDNLKSDSSAWNIFQGEQTLLHVDTLSDAFASDPYQTVATWPNGNGGHQRSQIHRRHAGRANASFTDGHAGSFDEAACAVELGHLWTYE